MRIVLFGVLMLVSVAGCAQTSTPRDRAWSAAREEILSRNHTGQLTPVQAQLELKRKYWEMFGGDEYMAGYFGYALSLLSSAQRGSIDPQEAQALVEAKEAEAFALASEARRRAERYRDIDNYRYN